jgi:hypothetical protein
VGLNSRIARADADGVRPRKNTETHNTGCGRGMPGAQCEPQIWAGWKMASRSGVQQDSEEPHESR